MKPSLKRVAVYVNNQIWVLRGAYELTEAHILNFLAYLKKGNTEVALVCRISLKDDCSNFPILTSTLSLPKQLLVNQNRVPQKLQNKLYEIDDNERDAQGNPAQMWLGSGSELSLREFRRGFPALFPEGRFWIYKNEIFVLEFPVSAEELHKFFLANTQCITFVGEDTDS